MNSLKHTVNPEELQSYMDKKLYNWGAAKTLAYAWNAGENVLFTGPGGYGKSDGATLFFDFLKERNFVEDIQPFVLSFGQGMTEERLFSGIDIKKFQDEGELVYNLKKAFVSYEVVIFEELFDAFAGVLLILKDVLQSGEVRMGDTRYPLRTKIVIACTNRSYDEVVVDNSTAALMERFVFQEEVTWTSWEASDYSAALGKNYNGEFLPLVADICAKSSKGEKKVSPRTAFKALKSVIKNNTISCLKSMLGIDRKVVAEAAANYQRDVDFAAWRSEVQEYIKFSPERNSAREWIEYATRGYNLKLKGQQVALTDTQIDSSKYQLEQLENKFNSNYNVGRKLVDTNTTNPYFMGVAQCKTVEEFIQRAPTFKAKAKEKAAQTAETVFLSARTQDHVYSPALVLQTNADTFMDMERAGWAETKVSITVSDRQIEIMEVRKNDTTTFRGYYHKVTAETVKSITSWFKLQFKLEGVDGITVLTAGVEVSSSGRVQAHHYFLDPIGNIWRSSSPMVLQGFEPMPIPQIQS